MNILLTKSFAIGVAILILGFIVSRSDSGQMTHYERELKLAEVSGDALEVELENASTRLFQKERVLLDLIENRVTLDQATELFLVLNRNGGTLDYFHHQYPHADHRELACRNVLAFAEVALHSPTDAYAPILNRWRTEFTQKYPHAAPLSDQQ